VSDEEILNDLGRYIDKQRDDQKWQTRLKFRI
jgi:hypothetical protein